MKNISRIELQKFRGWLSTLPPVKTAPLKNYYTSEAEREILMKALYDEYLASKNNGSENGLKGSP